MALATSRADAANASQELIGKSEIRITDTGAWLPALWAMGRMAAYWSPDNKVVYTVAYDSVPQKKVTERYSSWMPTAVGTTAHSYSFLQTKATFIKEEAKSAFLSSESGSSQLWELGPRLARTGSNCLNTMEM